MTALEEVLAVGVGFILGAIVVTLIVQGRRR